MPFFFKTVCFWYILVVCLDFLSNRIWQSPVCFFCVLFRAPRRFFWAMKTSIVKEKNQIFHSDKTFSEIFWANALQKQSARHSSSYFAYIVYESGGWQRGWEEDRSSRSRSSNSSSIKMCVSMDFKLLDSRAWPQSTPEYLFHSAFPNYPPLLLHGLPLAALFRPAPFLLPAQLSPLLWINVLSYHPIVPLGGSILPENINITKKWVPTPVPITNSVKTIQLITDPTARRC